MSYYGKTHETKGKYAMILHTLVLGALQTNCYIWADEKTGNAIVIDAPDDADKIIEYAQKNSLSITDIILTHGHFDHILALRELKEKTGARLSVYEKTVNLLKDRVLNLCHYVGISIDPIEPDKLLSDGDIIDFCGNKITVIHTPGHTEDCICLHNGDTLISGDTLFKLSVGRWDHPTGCMEDEINSINQRLMVLDDCVKVYPGHGPSTTIGEERRGNPYLR